MKVAPTPVLLLAIAALAAGCVSSRPSARQRPEMGTVIDGRLGQTFGAVNQIPVDRRYVVAQPPPVPASAPRHLKPVRPAREAVWIDGYWAYTGNPSTPYEWMAGHWEIPPAGARAWVPSGWQRAENTYVYVRGGWK
jgi:hypothetical protein